MIKTCGLFKPVCVWQRTQAILMHLSISKHIGQGSLNFLAQCVETMDSPPTEAELIKHSINFPKCLQIKEEINNSCGNYIQHASHMGHIWEIETDCKTSDEVEK